MKHQEVVGLEAPAGLRDAFPLHEFFGSDLLLSEPGCDLLPEHELEMTGAAQALVDFVRHRLDAGALHAQAGQREQRELHLAGRPNPVTRLRRLALVLRGREAVGHLSDDRATERLLGIAQHLTRARMADLAAFAHHLEDDSRLKAAGPADRQRHIPALDLEDLRFDAREKRDGLVDQRTDRNGWRAAGWRSSR